MTQSAPLDQETSDIVLGVDTHKDVHVAAVVSAAGVFVKSRSFQTTAEGYEQLLARTLGRLTSWCVIALETWMPDRGFSSVGGVAVGDEAGDG
ncbi:hypothetical protein ACWGH7_34305, partial [Streptomyces cyaneofuscatus]